MANRPWEPEREKLRYLLKSLRKDTAKLTQVDVSRALKKPQSYVSKYETGERRLDYVEVNEVCKIFGISMRKFCELYDKELQKIAQSSHKNDITENKLL